MAGAGNVRAARRRSLNPLDYAGGSALGKQLRHVDWPKGPSQAPTTGPPIVIPGGRKRRGAAGYTKGPGRPS